MLQSSSKLLGSELQALLSPYKSAACWRESPLLRSFEERILSYGFKWAQQVLCVESWVYPP